MEEIVKRLHEKRKLEQAKSLLESEGYVVSSNDIDSKMDDIEYRTEEIVRELEDTLDEEIRSEYIDELEEMLAELSDMEEDMTDEQYQRSEDLRHSIVSAENTEYDGEDSVRYDPYEDRGIRQSDFY